MSGASGPTATPFDSSTAAASAFRAVKALVVEWCVVVWPHAALAVSRAATKEDVDTNDGRGGRRQRFLCGAGGWMLTTCQTCTSPFPPPPRGGARVVCRSRLVAEQRNQFADLLLQALYRWIKSSASRLHEPALQNLLQTLMRKVRSTRSASCARWPDGCLRTGALSRRDAFPPTAPLRPRRADGPRRTYSSSLSFVGWARQSSTRASTAYACDGIADRLGCPNHG